MSIEQLQQVVQSPSAPVETGTSTQWSGVEQQLGITLPKDYQALVTTYGTGGFNDFLSVFTPFAANPNLNLGSQISAITRGYRTMRQEFPNDAPYAIYPEPEGLFPWAVTGNGDTLYWLTEGDPDSWPIVLFDGDHMRHERYDLSATEFLAALFGGSLQSQILPDDLLEEDGPQFFETYA